MWVRPFPLPRAAEDVEGGTGKLVQDVSQLSLIDRSGPGAVIGGRKLARHLAGPAHRVSQPANGDAGLVWPGAAS